MISIQYSRLPLLILSVNILTVSEHRYVQFCDYISVSHTTATLQSPQKILSLLQTAWAMSMDRTVLPTNTNTSFLTTWELCSLTFSSHAFQRKLLASYHYFLSITWHMQQHICTHSSRITFKIPAFCVSRWQVGGHCVPGDMWVVTAFSTWRRDWYSEVDSLSTVRLVVTVMCSELIFRGRQSVHCQTGGHCDV